MKRALLAAFVITAIGGIATAAAYSSSEQDSLIRATTIRPCDWWRYDSTSGNYGCSNYPFSIQVVEAAEVNRIVTALERRIENLEARIADLELEHETN